MSFSSPRELRRCCREGRCSGPTCGLCPGFVQANLVALPETYAADFERFCVENPRPCPLLEKTAPGSFTPVNLAPDADLRTDLPRYRVLHRGEPIAFPTDATPYWRDDLVAFLLGCSFTFEEILMRAGVPLRHLEQGRNVPMYRTNLECNSVGPFRGPLVVSLRPMPPDQAELAARLTSNLRMAHGAPLHVGDPRRIGIENLDRPDYGDLVSLHEGDVCVFWACGVTPLEAIIRAQTEWAIVHEPGHMFVTDRRIDKARALIEEPRP